jgi:hypothetical protein
MKHDHIDVNYTEKSFTTLSPSVNVIKLFPAQFTQLWYYIFMVFYLSFINSGVITPKKFYNICPKRQCYENFLQHNFHRY